MNVLAVGAHPDDVDLYAGGLVAALARAVDPRRVLRVAVRHQRRHDGRQLVLQAAVIPLDLKAVLDKRRVETPREKAVAVQQALVERDIRRHAHHAVLRQRAPHPQATLPPPGTRGPHPSGRTDLPLSDGP